MRRLSMPPLWPKTPAEHPSQYHPLPPIMADGLSPRAAPAASDTPPAVVAVQTQAIVDHLCVIRDEAELKSLVVGAAEGWGAGRGATCGV